MQAVSATIEALLSHHKQPSREKSKNKEGRGTGKEEKEKGWSTVQQFSEEKRFPCPRVCACASVFAGNTHTQCTLAQHFSCAHMHVYHNAYRWSETHAHIAVSL